MISYKELKELKNYFWQDLRNFSEHAYNNNIVRSSTYNILM